MTSITTKALIIGGCMTGATAIGGTAYYLTNKDKTESQKEEKQEKTTNQQTKPKQSINALLKLKNKTILAKTSTNDQKWNEKWIEFKKAYENLKKEPSAWLIENYDSTHKSVNVAPDVFKDKCISNGEVKVAEESEKLFEDVLKYCVGDA